MKNFKLGLQLYSVRDDMAADMDGTLGKISEMGYEYVEFAGYFGKTADEIKALLDKHGLKCISVHQNIELFLEKGQEAVDYIKTFGVKYPTIPHYPISKLAGTPDWDKTVANFAAIGQLLRDNGMQLLYHNHDFEFNTHNGKYLIDYIFDTLPNDLILPEFDTCWVKYGGADPCEYVEKFAGKIKVLHLKDFTCNSLSSGQPVYALIDKNGNVQNKSTIADNGFRYRPCGMGMQDFNSILTSAEKSGVEYLIVEQDMSDDMPPLEAVKISCDYFRNLGI